MTSNPPVNSHSELEKIREVLAKVFQLRVTEVPPDASMVNFHHWDSLNHLKVILAVEKEYQVKFRPEELRKIDSIESILQFLNKKEKTN